MNVTRLEQTDKYCVFRQGHVWFALPAVSVLEVAENPGIVPVPGANSVLAGLCHLRNEFLAVLDLRCLAGEDGDVQEAQQLLVVHSANGPWAIRVDRVEGLEVLDVSITQDARPNDAWSATMIGLATRGEQAVRVLEPRRLYRFAENMLRDAWSDASPANGDAPPRSFAATLAVTEPPSEV